MNILLLNHYAGSPEMGMEFRPYYFAREWMRMGHSVRIVAGGFSHLRIKNPKITKDFQEKMVGGIPYSWIRTGDYRGNGVRRAFTMFRFTGKLWLKASWIAKNWKPDVVIASSTYPLDTFAAQRIARKAGAQLIHEVHDMWPITLIELGGMRKWNPFVVLMQMAENSFCRHSDQVVSLLPNADSYFIKHGMQSEKFKTVSNGIVLKEWKNANPLPESHEKVFKKLKEENQFIICFFGSHTKSYALDYLIQAIQKMKQEDISVVFVGEGNQKSELMQLAEKEMGTHFFFLPSIPKTSIPSLVQEADVLYVGALKNDMFRFGICMNKLFDSMMSGKPILYAVDAPNNYIEEYGCGITVEAENADALLEGIKKLKEMSEEERLQMGQNGRNAVLKKFTYTKLAEEFASVFEEKKR